LDFLSTTDVGRLAPALVEKDAQPEGSEWELREWREIEVERREEVEELGAGDEEQPLFLPGSRGLLPAPEGRVRSITHQLPS